jgi:hypothetical protein
MGATKNYWPQPLKWMVSAGLGFHIVAMLAIALAGNPSSELEHRIARPFVPYAVALGLDSTHRYYAPEPPPTPVLTAEIVFDNARASKRIRIPDRDLRPRLRYQRQLALAYHLYMENQQRMAGQEPGDWARSFARHLFFAYPEATAIVLRAQQHLIPNPEALAERRRLGQTIDPEAPESYTLPEVVGEFQRPARGNPNAREPPR